MLKVLHSYLSTFFLLLKKNTELILERKSRISMLYRSHEGCLHLSAFSIRACYMSFSRILLENYGNRSNTRLD